MLIPAVLAKLHRVRVTEANLDYVGSITIDSDLLKASGLMPYQKVHVNSVENGTHWETYILEGPAGSGKICLNGPPAHFFKPGHIVIIVGYGQLTPEELKTHVPTVVFVDEKNKVTKIQKHASIPLGATGPSKAVSTSKKKGK